VTTICVPDDDFAVALADIGAGVGRSILVWAGTRPVPDEAADIEFLVAPYELTAWDRELLGQLPRLRVIQLLTAGVEPWLDRVPEGVLLCGARGLHSGSTAELAVAAILSHLHELPRFADQQRRHVWDRHFTDGLRARRVLVLGAGEIGARVAEVARVFDASVRVVARTARDGVHSLEELPQLLPDAEIVVIALPNTPQTTGLVDAGFLAALPDGALVVNVARGALLQTDALLAELTAGRLYAFLDVVEGEPLPSDHPLWTAPNLVITPHVGGGSTGWQQVAQQMVRAQVQRYLGGDPLRNVVTDGY
jgi:phosphoglycerate dehydrogenase-like enzyme